jgi:hypothetical protein
MHGVHIGVLIVAGTVVIMASGPLAGCQTRSLKGLVAPICDWGAYAGSQGVRPSPAPISTQPPPPAPMTNATPAEPTALPDLAVAPGSHEVATPAPAAEPVVRETVSEAWCREEAKRLSGRNEETKPQLPTDPLRHAFVASIEDADRHRRHFAQQRPKPDAQETWRRPVLDGGKLDVAEQPDADPQRVYVIRAVSPYVSRALSISSAPRYTLDEWLCLIKQLVYDGESVVIYDRDPVPSDGMVWPHLPPNVPKPWKGPYSIRRPQWGGGHDRMLSLDTEARDAMREWGVRIVLLGSARP